MDIIKGPDCILLDIINSKKRPAKLLFKQDKNSQCHNKPRSRLPVDILLHLSWYNLNCSGCGFCQKQQFKRQDNLKELLKNIVCHLFAKYSYNILYWNKTEYCNGCLPLLMLLPVHALAIRIMFAALIFCPCCMKLLGFLLPPIPSTKSLLSLYFLWKCLLHCCSVGVLGKVGGGELHHHLVPPQKKKLFILQIARHHIHHLKYKIAHPAMQGVDYFLLS